MYRVTQLKNGLTVATAEMPQMMSVSVGLWIGMGSRYEPPQFNGVCHFIEHLLFKGQRLRTFGVVRTYVDVDECPTWPFRRQLGTESIDVIVGPINCNNFATINRGH